MTTKHLMNTVELLYLAYMLRWEQTAPPDKHKGNLDDEPAWNSQQARLAFVLKKIAAGVEQRTYMSLSQYTRREDGHSNISQDSSWMNRPIQLCDGWFLEGCANIDQKQRIIQNVTKFGLSSTFAACFDDFVAGKSVKSYLPTPQEQDELVRDLHEKGEIDFE